MPQIVSVQKVSARLLFEGVALSAGLAEGEAVGLAVGMEKGRGANVFSSYASSISNASGFVVVVGSSKGTARLLPVASAAMASATTMKERTASAAICKEESFFMFFLTFCFSLWGDQSKSIPIRSRFCPNAF